jgi:twitching motility protein PilT
METLTLDDADKARVNDALAQCALFRALKPEHMPQILKAAQVLRFGDGETVIRQGEPSDSFFVLVQGEAAIRIEGAQGDGAAVELGRVPHPASFGEIGLLLDEPRTASVVAADDLLVLKFGAKAFDAMFQKIPEFGAALSAGLAHRVRQLSGRVPLPDYDTRKGPPKGEVATLLPLDFQQRHRVLPLEVDGNVLTLGLVDEPARHVIRAVREHVPGMELHPVRIDRDFYDSAMQQVAGIKEWTGPHPKPAAAEAPAARAPRLDALLERMVAEGASDLHLSAGHRPHWRVDGDMKALSDTAVLGGDEVFTLLEPVMEARHREQFETEGDSDFAYTIPGVARFRVNVFRDHRGVNAVFRLIPSKILSLEQLALPPVIQNFCDMPKGMVLVTGPTGSGKSTTLAAMVDTMNRKQKLHIVTIEDPIEFLHQSDQSLINQRELGGHTRSFARALRAALREDPDVILVGEMRDLETIALALEAANTGHLVLATLHTNSAVGAVDRIIDQFPAGQQEQIRSVLADVLRGVVAQTLVRGVNGGRLAALEVLVVNFAASNLIREGKTVQIPSIMQANKALGMSLLNEELGRLVEAKKITMEEALSASIDKEDLHRRFRSGVTLAATPPEYDRFRVMNVDADSPGAQAGLQRGDMILELETRPAKDFTLDEARQILRTDGRRLLTVDRSGKRVKITLDMKRF